LIVWQVAMELVVAVYALLRQLPTEERFALSAQLRRAVVSVPANIAEGEGRRGARELAHHLGIARGSLAEVDTLIRICVRLGSLSDTDIGTASRLVIRTRQLYSACFSTPSEPGRAQAPHARRPTSQPSSTAAN
jgi:four helix bundle protein